MKLRKMLRSFYRTCWSGQDFKREISYQKEKTDISALILKEAHHSHKPQVKKRNPFSQIITEFRNSSRSGNDQYSNKKSVGKCVEVHSGKWQC
jgi:hypothetical protein